MKTLSYDERTDLHQCGHFECVQMLSLLSLRHRHRHRPTPSATPS